MQQGAIQLTLTSSTFGGAPSALRPAGQCLPRLHPPTPRAVCPALLQHLSFTLPLDSVGLMASWRRKLPPTSGSLSPGEGTPPESAADPGIPRLLVDGTLRLSNLSESCASPTCSGFTTALVVLIRSYGRGIGAKAPTKDSVARRSRATSQPTVTTPPRGRDWTSAGRASAARISGQWATIGVRFSIHMTFVAVGACQA